MIDGGIEGKPGEVLDYTYPFSVSLCPPITLVGPSESRFHDAFAKDIAAILGNKAIQIVLVHGGVVIENALILELDMSLLDGVIFAEEVIEEGSYEFDAFVLEIVAVGRAF
jgi:hypothetical protein